MSRVAVLHARTHAGLKMDLTPERIVQDYLTDTGEELEGWKAACLIDRLQALYDTLEAGTKPTQDQLAKVQQDWLNEDVNEPVVVVDEGYKQRTYESAGYKFTFRSPFFSDLYKNQA